MAQINKIQVDSNEYNVKDALSRPIILERGSSASVTLPNNLTLQDIYDAYQENRPIFVLYNNRYYHQTDITLSGSNITFNFLTLIDKQLSSFSGSGATSATTVYFYGPTTSYLVQGMKPLITSSLSRTTNTTATIPDGYGSGHLTIWGRPKAGNTGYLGIDVPIGQLSTTQKAVVIADDSNQINYKITKNGSTLTFTFGSASSTAGVWSAIYISP